MFSKTQTNQHYNLNVQFKFKNVMSGREKELTVYYEENLGKVCRLSHTGFRIKVESWENLGKFVFFRKFQDKIYITIG